MQKYRNPFGARNNIIKALLDLETERELEKMQSKESSSPMDHQSYMFQDKPSYSNKRVQRKLHVMETKLQEQFKQVLSAEKDHQNLSRKLQLLNQHDGYHQTKCNIEKKLSDNITENEPIIWICNVPFYHSDRTKIILGA